MACHASALVPHGAHGGHEDGESRPDSLPAAGHHASQPATATAAKACYICLSAVAVAPAASAAFLQVQAFRSAPSLLYWPLPQHPSLNFIFIALDFTTMQPSSFARGMASRPAAVCRPSCVARGASGDAWSDVHMPELQRRMKEVSSSGLEQAQQSTSSPVSGCETAPPQCTRQRTTLSNRTAGFCAPYTTPMASLHTVI